MRIGVDIDGVLFPWDDVARRVVTNKWGVILDPVLAGNVTPYLDPVVITNALGVT